MACIMFMFNLWAWSCWFLHLCAHIDFSSLILGVKVLKWESLWPYSRQGLPVLWILEISAMFSFVMVNEVNKEVVFQSPLVPPAVFYSQFLCPQVCSNGCLYFTFSNYWLCLTLPMIFFPFIALLSSSLSEEAVMIVSRAELQEAPATSFTVLMSLINELQIHRNWSWTWCTA